MVSLEIRTGDVGETGSGVVIDGNGYILTNNHVVSTGGDRPAGDADGRSSTTAAQSRVPGSRSSAATR